MHVVRQYIGRIEAVSSHVVRQYVGRQLVKKHAVSIHVVWQDTCSKYAYS